jgi:hypothetical protein
MLSRFTLTQSEQETVKLLNTLLRHCEFLIVRNHNIDFHNTTLSTIAAELPCFEEWGAVCALRARPYSSSVEKPLAIIRKMSTSAGAAFVVTKLPKR